MSEPRVAHVYSDVFFKPEWRTVDAEGRYELICVIEYSAYELLKEQLVRYDKWLEGGIYFTTEEYQAEVEKYNQQLKVERNRRAADYLSAGEIINNLESERDTLKIENEKLKAARYELDVENSKLKAENEHLMKKYDLQILVKEREELKAENKILKDKLSSILEIGKRDMGNPKYDPVLTEAEILNNKLLKIFEKI